MNKYPRTVHTADESGGQPRSDQAHWWCVPPLFPLWWLWLWSNGYQPHRHAMATRDECRWGKIALWRSRLFQHYNFLCLKVLTFQVWVEYHRNWTRQALRKKAKRAVGRNWTTMRGRHPTSLLSHTQPSSLLPSAALLRGWWLWAASIAGLRTPFPSIAPQRPRPGRYTHHCCHGVAMGCILIGR